MAEISFSLSVEMREALESRVSGAGFEDIGSYLCALVTRDLEEAARVKWIREQIAAGEASGIIDRDPHELIEEIIANRRARHDR
ncbi:MAG: ribbon-helix-helix domain-containing protein [Novosphingobium sp.]